mmetsp:Transcript_29821/g.59435  ORF Transcript_29821/g.59435 Transcript_29821/m.59435 type:complete len:85 (+) Transcript_29821:862-1116(+)
MSPIRREGVLPFFVVGVTLALTELFRVLHFALGSSSLVVMSLCLSLIIFPPILQMTSSEAKNCPPLRWVSLLCTRRNEFQISTG